MLIDLLVVKPGNTLIVFRLTSDKKVMPGFTVRVPPELHGCTNADVTVIVKQIASQSQGCLGRRDQGADNRTCGRCQTAERSVDATAREQADH